MEVYTHAFNLSFQIYSLVSSESHLHSVYE